MHRKLLQMRHVHRFVHLIEENVTYRMRSVLCYHHYTTQSHCFAHFYVKEHVNRLVSDGALSDPSRVQPPSSTRNRRLVESDSPPLELRVLLECCCNGFVIPIPHRGCVELKLSWWSGKLPPCRGPTPPRVSVFSMSLACTCPLHAHVCHR